MIVQEDRNVTKELLKRYYSNHFEIEPLVNLIGLSGFSTREFGFDLGNNIFIRNLSFKTPTELVKFLGEKGVFQAYIGAVYDRGPSKENPIQKLNWIFREVVFDIDLDDFDSVRKCGCRGADQFCKECWSLIQDAMVFLDETLRLDFGFKELKWFFSGRRGVHCWIKDEFSKFLDQDQRAAIIDYLNLLPHDERLSPQFVEIPRFAKSLRDRIFSWISRSYFIHSTVDELKKLKFSQKDIENIKSYVLEKKDFKIEDYLQVVPDKINPTHLVNAIVVSRYPRIDRKVTIDTRRLLRIPRSIHRITGKVCVEIKELDNFYPDDAPSIFDFCAS